MASARYTLNITEEDLKQDEVVELTKEEKRANWWHYNKIWVIFVGFLALLAAWLIHDVVTKVDPDANIALLTTAYLSEETLTSLEDQLAPYFSDINGDGEVCVNVVQLTLNLADRSLNADLQYEIKMSSEMQLATDISTSTSIIWITDGFSGLQEYASVFAFPDDPLHYPTEEEQADFDRMTVRWGDSEFLSSIKLEGMTRDPATGKDIPIQDLFADFDVAMRTLFDAEDEEILGMFNDAVRFMKLVRGVEE